jgi:hypothetical protein
MGFNHDLMNLGKQENKFEIYTNLRNKIKWLME